MTEKSDRQTENRNEPHTKGPWSHIIRGMWRSPLGLMGVTITTISATLLVIGMMVDLLGFFNNPYAGFFTYLILPGLMLTGLAMIPVAAFLRRRKWFKHGISREHLTLNLSDHTHRRWVVGFLVLTVINLCIFAMVAYEGYHFSDSAYFCGQVCHQVMEPEYTVYQRSPHARVVCVECHIGPGADWFVRAKISGLRQVVAIFTNSYSRPIPAPVEHLRPARDTCETCHWPEKFHGKKVKSFKRFTNSNQSKPEVTEIALHIGGRNPETDAFEGIHWHVSKNVKVQYLAEDEKRTKIARVKVTRPDGKEEEFVKSDLAEIKEDQGHHWRTMDCIDCHNRPTHVYQMPDERVDFGLLSRRINPDIPGMREDSLAVLTYQYATRKEAEARMVDALIALQTKRDPAMAKQHEADIKKGGDFLLEAYLGNVWPEMNIHWGTYKMHLGHQYADDGYGCWRCHDEEHVNAEGKTITQDCALCHDSP